MQLLDFIARIGAVPVITEQLIYLHRLSYMRLSYRCQYNNLTAFIAAITISSLFDFKLHCGVMEY
jgi:hypothetical protein